MQDGLGSKICQRAVGNGDRLTNRWMDGWMLWHWHPVTGGWIWHAWLALLAEDRRLWGTQGQGAIINLSLICIETQSYWDSSVPGTQRKKGGKTFFKFKADNSTWGNKSKSEDVKAKHGVWGMSREKTSGTCLFNMAKISEPEEKFYRILEKVQEKRLSKCFMTEYQVMQPTCDWGPEKKKTRH